MLFDLRSRGRRRTVQVVYLTLAVLIAAGLILFGVGTGTGGGGLFGAFTGNSSSNGQSSAINSQTKNAVKATKTHPGSAAAWASLVAARYTAANTAGYDQSTGTFNSTGKQQLGLAAQAYSRYTKLTSKVSSDTATYAARAYGQLGRYSDASTAWQAVVSADSSNLKGLECVALSASAAKQTRVAELAENQLLGKLAKAQRASAKTLIESAKTQPSVVAQDC